MPVLSFIEFEPNNNEAHTSGPTIIRLNLWETQVAWTVVVTSTLRRFPKITCRE